VKWTGRSHNHLVPRRGIEYLEAKLLPHDQLRIRHDADLSKSRSYQLAGTALEYLAVPDAPRWGFLLSRYLASSGRPLSALPIAEKLDRPGVSPAMRSAALSTVALALAASGASDDAVDEVLFRAARRDSTRRDPLLSLASRSVRRGDLQAAASLARAALAIPARVGLAEAEGNLSTRPHAILYWALLWLGRKDEARAHFEVCRREDPANPAFVEHERLFAA